LQKPTDGAQRPATRLRIDRTRASSASLNGRSIRAARAIRSWFRGLSPVLDRRLRPAVSGAIRPLLTAERALPIAVAAIVAVASLLALLPSGPAGAVGGTTGAGEGARIAIGGGFGPEPLEALPGEMAASDPEGELSFQPLTLPADVTAETDVTPETEVTAESDVIDEADVAVEAGTQTGDVEAGAFLDDGTLLTGYAPETTVEDGADLVKTYKVKSGDTLSGIARQFGVRMMTLWWANKLESKDELHVGQVLRIPPVNGLVVTVTATDTLESLAAQHKVKPAKVLEINGLDDPTLVAGQVLVLPGAKGEPIPTPKPTPKPAVRSSRGGGGGGGGSHSGGVGGSYSGGAMRWPVIGGGNYISQHFHYGHYGLDIAADYGSRVVAAARGKVTFAGWKSNGGGYQVWISHGGGVYTTYNHMAGVSVGAGQYVGRGQQVGRVGASGYATGPHLHFEVWRGPIWNGGTRVNPLRYL
jgi:murein DD-endopeptidase MepM/ murein hydrolase activator NlpD